MIRCKAMVTVTSQKDPIPCDDEVEPNCDFCRWHEGGFSIGDKGCTAREAQKARVLPQDSAERKDLPMCTGLLDYFPNALALVSQVSKKGNDKHNPGQPMHHDRSKSTGHLDSAVRHILERGERDAESGLPNLAHAIWRLCAQLQQDCEAEGAPLARGAKAAP